MKLPDAKSIHHRPQNGKSQTGQENLTWLLGGFTGISHPERFLCFVMRCWDVALGGEKKCRKSSDFDDTRMLLWWILRFCVPWWHRDVVLSTLQNQIRLLLSLILDSLKEAVTVHQMIRPHHEALTAVVNSGGMNQQHKDWRIVPPDVNSPGFPLSFIGMCLMHAPLGRKLSRRDNRWTSQCSGVF